MARCECSFGRLPHVVLDVIVSHIGPLEFGQTGLGETPQDTKKTTGRDDSDWPWSEDMVNFVPKHWHTAKGWKATQSGTSQAWWSDHKAIMTDFAFVTLVSAAYDIDLHSNSDDRDRISIRDAVIPQTALLRLLCRCCPCLRLYAQTRLFNTVDAFPAKASQASVMFALCVSSNRSPLQQSLRKLSVNFGFLTYFLDEILRNCSQLRSLKIAELEAKAGVRAALAMHHAVSSLRHLSFRDCAVAAIRDILEVPGLALESLALYNMRCACPGSPCLIRFTASKLHLGPHDFSSCRLWLSGPPTVGQLTLDGYDDRAAWSQVTSMFRKTKVAILRLISSSPRQDVKSQHFKQPSESPFGTSAHNVTGHRAPAGDRNFWNGLSVFNVSQIDARFLYSTWTLPGMSKGHSNMHVLRLAVKGASFLEKLARCIKQRAFPELRQLTLYTECAIGFKCCMVRHVSGDQWRTPAGAAHITIDLGPFASSMRDLRAVCAESQIALDTTYMAPCLCEARSVPQAVETWAAVDPQNDGWDIAPPHGIDIDPADAPALGLWGPDGTHDDYAHPGFGTWV